MSEVRETVSLANGPLGAAAGSPGGEKSSTRAQKAAARFEPERAVLLSLAVTRRSLTASKTTHSTFTAYAQDHNSLHFSMVNAIPGRFNWRVIGYKKDDTGRTIAAKMAAKITKTGEVIEAIATVA